MNKKVFGWFVFVILIVMRNEAVGILILAYIIGFNTAYIAFGLNQEGIDLSKPQPVVFSSAAVGLAVEQNLSASAISFNNQGLFANVEDKSVVISGALSEDIEPGPGFHADVPFYEISPSGKFIYYCEQEVADSDICKEYVYVVAEHKSYPLDTGKIDNSAMVETTSQFRWLADDRAAYGDLLVSVSAQEPWIFE